MAAFERARNQERDRNTRVTGENCREFARRGRGRDRRFRSNCFEQQGKAGNALHVPEEKSSCGGGKTATASAGKPRGALARKLPEVFATRAVEAAMGGRY